MTHELTVGVCVCVLTRVRAACLPVCLRGGKRIVCQIQPPLRDSDKSIIADTYQKQVIEFRYRRSVRACTMREYLEAIYVYLMKYTPNEENVTDIIQIYCIFLTRRTLQINVI